MDNTLFIQALFSSDRPISYFVQGDINPMAFSVFTCTTKPRSAYTVIKT